MLVGALQDAGVGPGDRVAITTPRKLEFLAAHLGALYAAGISLPLNPRLTRDELRYCLADSRAAAIVADQQLIVESLRSDLPELCAVLPDSHPSSTPRAGTPSRRLIMTLHA